MRPQRVVRTSKHAARRAREGRSGTPGAAQRSSSRNKLKPTVYIAAVPALVPPRAQAS